MRKLYIIYNIPTHIAWLYPYQVRKWQKTKKMAIYTSSYINLSIILYTLQPGVYLSPEYVICSRISP